MAKTKYGKYIITEPKPEDVHRASEYVKFPIYVDDEYIKGAHYFMGAWWQKVTGRGSPPNEHIHDFDEYLMFVGTNHEDPHELGGEVEIWLGGEKHIVTKTCTVFVPAGVKHCPVYFRRIDTPIWYFATAQIPMYIKGTDT